VKQTVEMWRAYLCLEIDFVITGWYLRLWQWGKERFNCECCGSLALRERRKKERNKDEKMNRGLEKESDNDGNVETKK
jgi:hypothetical protein